MNPFRTLRRENDQLQAEVLTLTHHFTSSFCNDMSRHASFLPETWQTLITFNLCCRFLSNILYGLFVFIEWASRLGLAFSHESVLSLSDLHVKAARNTLRNQKLYIYSLVFTDTLICIKKRPSQITIYGKKTFRFRTLSNLHKICLLLTIKGAIVNSC